MVHDQLLDLTCDGIGFVERDAEELPRQVVHMPGQVGRWSGESLPLLFRSLGGARAQGNGEGREQRPAD